MLAALNSADAMVSIEGENRRGITWVVIEEVDSGDWGIGGKPLSTEDVQGASSRNAGRASDRGTETAMKLDMTNDGDIHERGD